jgi:cell division protein FtsL
MQIKILDQDKALAYIRRFNDIRFAGQVLFVVIILLVSWSGIKSIQTNYGLQKQISALDQQNNVQRLENNNLALQNQYFKSRQYLELAARQNFGLALPGEKEIIVPTSVALANTTDLPVESVTQDKPSQPPAFQKHIQAWRDFFLHRQN